ncbi:MAG: hydrogenase nickel incorporation protein HypB [Synechococcus lacustris]
MCLDCNCGQPQNHSHDHSHDHGKKHSHTHLQLGLDLLARNNELAQQNRQRFASSGLTVINLLSSPGSGKTALLERLAKDWAPQHPLAVVVGDLATDNDAQRLRRAGVEAIQITTGQACHLEAAMVQRAVAELQLNELELLVIENVGNLVCPAAYDLGESLRLVMLSVTEGEDKPLKYPSMFQSADLVLISKIDLASAVEFNHGLAHRHIKQVAPAATVLKLSAKTGAGMEQLYGLLQQGRGG